MFAQGRRRHLDPGRSPAEFDAAPHQAHFPHPGVLHLDRKAILPHLRIVKDLAQSVKRGTGDIVRLQPLQPLLTPPATKDRLQEAGQKIIVLDAAFAVTKTRIFRPFFFAHDLQKTTPKFLRRGKMDHKREPVFVDKSEDAGSFGPVGPARDNAGFKVAGGILADKRKSGAKKRGLDPLPLSRNHPVNQGPQNPITGIDPREMIREGNSHSLRFLRIGKQTQ